MKLRRILVLLLALCLLLTCVPAVTAEDVGDALFAAPVDEEVEETETAKLWSEEIAKDVAEAEAAAEEAAAVEEAAKPGDGDFQIVNGVLVKYNGEGGDVVVPDGVRVIGESAFSDRSDLTSITLPDGLTSIGDWAFYGCYGLTSVTLPDSLTIIGNYAFFYCDSLTSIILPDSLTSLGWCAFGYCTGLMGITLPDSLTDISGAFFGCAGLTSITLPDSLTSVDGSAFCDCTGLTSITLPDGLTSIGRSAFEGCSGLTSITIPKNVAYIGAGAFKNCYGITSLTINATGDIDIEDSAFSTCYGLTTVYTICETPATQWARAQGYTVETTDHTSVIDPAVAPTLTSSGLTEGSHCSVCGAVLVEQEWIDPLIDIADSEIAAIADKTYTGKAIKPKPVVKYGGVKLVKGTDYTVAWKKNTNIGKATVTVTGIGKYGGTKSVTFKINPKKVALSKLTAGKKKLTVQWKKTVGGAGYQIQYGLKKNFAGAKTVTITKNKTVKTVLKKLKSGKTYYVRIRGYKKVGKVKYVSKWSKVKKAKVN